MRAAAHISPTLRDWSSSGQLTSHFRYDADGGPFAVAVRASGGRHYQTTIGDRVYALELRQFGENESQLVVDGKEASVLHYMVDERNMHVSLGRCSGTWVNSLGRPDAADERVDSGIVRAPMHGLLADIFVTVGDRVAVGDRLFMLEAMKMQHEMTASVAGVVNAIHFEEASQVAADCLIMELSPEACESC